LGLNSDHALAMSNTPLTIKIHDFCLAKITKKGSVENILADTAPSPSVTSKIGRAQQISVADDVNRMSHPHRLLSIRLV